MDSIVNFINETIKKHDYISRDIKLEDKLKDDIGLDSLGILTLVDELEEKFEISLDPEDLQKNPETISDLATIVNSKLG